ncbi:MAG: diacylglycerol kinase family protein [Catalinimonas sp.]
MPSLPRVRFVINPIAGVHGKQDVPALIERHLDRHRAHVEVVLSEYAGHAPILTRQAVAEGVDVMVAVGGDGTINEVAGQLVGTQTALGIVPLGSGNGLARHLGLPLTATGALQRLNARRIVRIDSGVIADRPFFCTAGLGFDAHVGAVFAAGETRGFQKYVRTTLREYFTYDPFRYRLQAGEHAVDQTAFTVTFANAGQYGNNAWIAPEADISDGLLDVCWMRPFPKWLFPVIGARLFSRRLHHSEFLKIYRAPRARLDFEGELPGHVDGEPSLFRGPLDVYVRPASLGVVV